MVEDQPICRMGIHSTLENSNLDYQIVAEVDTVAKAISYLEQNGNQTDLILLDYMLPDGTGMDVIGAAKQLCPDAKIVIFSGEAGGATVKQLLEAGVNGFMIGGDCLGVAFGDGGQRLHGRGPHAHRERPQGRLRDHEDPHAPRDGTH